MFYEEFEKKIYTPQGTELKLDPLEIDAKMRIASQGRLNELISDWKAVTDNQGDIGPGAKEQREVISANAELNLAAITKQVFNLPQDTLNGVALEYLIDFLEYMEGKGERGKSPHQSIENSISH